MNRLLSLVALMSFAALARSQAPAPVPGLTIPSTDRPWVVEEYQGKMQLVPMHSSAAQRNNHLGSNTTKSLLGSFFYKPRITVEIKGPHAATIVHTNRPTFYLHAEPDPDEGESMMAGWAITPVAIEKDHRVTSTIRFTQLTGKAKREDDLIQVDTENLPDHWLRLTLRSDLNPGEYALVPVWRQQDLFSVRVFDFQIDPSAPNDADAIKK